MDTYPTFSSDSTLLCASSSHGTIHVFSVEDPKRNKQSSLLSSTPFLGAGKNLVGNNKEYKASRQVRDRGFYF